MEGFDYRMFQTGDDQGGAIMPSETPGTGPIVYFDTDDIDASIAKVRELGGTADDKQPVPTHGWFARVQGHGGQRASASGRATSQRRVTSAARSRSPCSPGSRARCRSR